MARTALVTGASRGLGAALAHGLATDGWDLVLTARTADDLAETARMLAGGTTVRVVPGDITDADHRAGLARAASALGRLDALVLNAGTLGPSPLPSVTDLDLDDLREVLEVNTVAQLGLIQALLPALRPGATVAAITSDAGVEHYPGWGAYGASKAALEHLTGVLAAERPDLRALRIDPGDLRTDMHQLAFPGEDISDRPLPEVAVPAIVRLLDGSAPSGRYRAAELAEVPA